MYDSYSLKTGPLASRTVSGFALSIGTGLALETLFNPRQPVYDKERKVPNRVDVKNYDQCWINIATLFRNIVGSIDKNDFLTLQPSEIAETLVSEIEIIYSLFSVEGLGLCKPFFYYCDYKTAYTKQKHNAVQLRHDKTDGQKHYTGKLVRVVEYLNKNYKNSFIHFDSEIRSQQQNQRIILISHMPWDLLSAHNFRKLDLLESHTGILKDKRLWYTKYYKVPNETLDHIPFLRKLLLIFGDSVMLSPMDIRFRKLIIEIAKKCKWTPLTTIDKVKLDLNIEIKERYLYEMFLIL